MKTRKSTQRAKAIGRHGEARGSAYGLRVIGCNWPLQEFYLSKARAEHARQASLYTPKQLEVLKISWRAVK